MVPLLLKVGIYSGNKNCQGVGLLNIKIMTFIHFLSGWGDRWVGHSWEQLWQLTKVIPFAVYPISDVWSIQELWLAFF